MAVYIISMSLLARKRARTRIITIVIFLIVLLISTPFFMKQYKIFHIKRDVVQNFQKNNLHSRILKKYTDETIGENFYFYIEYQEGNSLYIAEYLCQNIHGQWEFDFIAKRLLKN